MGYRQTVLCWCAPYTIYYLKFRTLNYVESAKFYFCSGSQIRTDVNLLRAFGLWARRATNCSIPRYILKQIAGLVPVPSGCNLGPSHVGLFVLIVPGNGLEPLTSRRINSLQNLFQVGHSNQLSYPGVSVEWRCVSLTMSTDAWSTFQV